MYNRFIEFINLNGLLDKGDSVLLAISGGMDSMVMLALFRASGFNIAIAHCNFQLRGKGSDDDEAFVRQHASSLQVDFFSRRFDTAAYAAAAKVSIQMAARQLRYAWLEEVRKQADFQAIATAHHFDDAIETLFINILRGTGVSGLKGIPKKRHHIVRPLLFATREEINTYAVDHAIRYREDASNKDEKYLRNKIRHKLLPVLRTVNPSLTGNLQHFFESMEDVEMIYKQSIAGYKKGILQIHDNEAHILIKPLQGIPFAATLLYEILKDYGFNPAQSREVFSCLHAQSGKTFTSETHCLVKDRDALIVYPRQPSTARAVHNIYKDTDHLACGNLFFRFMKGAVDDGFRISKSPQTLTADMDKLSFPLTLRPWAPGDKLVPLGMKGHKKVSDLLVDKKVPLHAKKDVMVLLSCGEIVWVAGLQPAERFRVTPKTTKTWAATVEKKQAMPL